MGEPRQGMAWEPFSPVRALLSAVLCGVSTRNGTKCRMRVLLSGSPGLVSKGWCWAGCGDAILPAAGRG